MKAPTNAESLPSEKGGARRRLEQRSPSAQKEGGSIDSPQPDPIRQNTSVEQPNEGPNRLQSAYELLKSLAGNRSVSSPSSPASRPRYFRAKRRRAFLGIPEHPELERRIANLERKHQRAKVRDPQVATRDIVIWQLKQNPDLGSPKNKEIASRLTEQGFKPPKKWGVANFDDAYRNKKLRRKLSKMISVAKPS